MHGCLLQLLERDPAKRLGSGGEDVKEVTRHPFFDGIDWDKLYNRGYQPPFNPNVVRNPETDVCAVACLKAP